MLPVSVGIDGFILFEGIEEVLWLCLSLNYASQVFGVGCWVVQLVLAVFEDFIAQAENVQYLSLELLFGADAVVAHMNC